jgi:hypothetical protein
MTNSSAIVDEADGVGTALESHTYTEPGVYTVTIAVTDDDGDTGQSVSPFVVVFEPAAGFVTGGGWIDSPLGASTADPGLSGTATFGFVSKYKKGAYVPDGDTQFQFKAGDLRFHSTSYEWLVVAGARAKFKGSGTVNDMGDYGFMVTCIDGQQSGGGGVDSFRIKIWAMGSEAVVYDNQFSSADDSYDTTALGGGSIVIHSQM